MSAPDNSPFAFRGPGGVVSPLNPDAPDQKAVDAEVAAEKKRKADEDARQWAIVQQNLIGVPGLSLGGYKQEAQSEGVTAPPPPPPAPAPRMPQRIVHEAPMSPPEGMRRREPVPHASMIEQARASTPTPSGGSGSYSVSAQGPVGGLGPIMRDYDEQLAGMEEEKNARAASNEAIGAQYGQAADEQRRLADEQMAHAREDNSNARRHLDEIGQLVSDYAQEKIDPMKWYHDKSVPQKIATVVGAMLSGWQGGPAGAQKFINDQVDRSIALQQEQLGRHGEAVHTAQNLYSSFLRTSENEQQAYDKTRAAMLSSAMIDVQKAAEGARTDEEKAQIDQMMAGLKLQRDMLLARLQSAAVAAKGGPAGPGPNGLEVDPKQIATGSNGQQYLITNSAYSDDISQNLAVFGRLKDSIMQGQQILDERQNGIGWAAPYSDNIQRGEAVNGAIYETASKLASARGMPAGLAHVVQQMVPDFGSRFAGATGAAKIPEVLKLLNQYEGEYLRAAGAMPSQITMGPGQGKEAGKLKYYAKPGVVTTPPSQSGEAGNPLLKSFQPGP